MTILQAFLGGLFLANGLPHLSKGITGQTFMTFFAKRSSAYLNIVWAFVNFVIAFIILGFNPNSGFLNLPTGINFWAFVFGAFSMGHACAWLFSNKDAKMPWHKD